MQLYVWNAFTRLKKLQHNWTQMRTYLSKVANGWFQKICYFVIIPIMKLFMIEI